LEEHLPGLVEQARRLLSIVEARKAQATARLVGERKTGNQVLRSLLDYISGVMLFRDSRHTQPEDVGRVIRAEVISALDKMDGEQKGMLLRCLHLSGLISQPRPLVDLSGADLSGVDLVDAVIPGICLYHADLTGGDLRRANLAGGNLIWACIDGVKFEGARLDGVILVGNEIERANLDVAFLRSLGAECRRPD